MTGRPGPTHYEILDISPAASRQEVAQALERARTVFGPGALASYALFSPEEAAALAARIEEAGALLLDARARERYDDLLSGRRAPVRPEEPPPTAGPPPAPAAPFEPPADAEWSGALIRQARLAAGLTVEHVSDRTKVQRAVIESIEEERHDRLPPAVYLRGILRSLAAVLRLDADRVARSYLDRVGRAR